MQRLLGGQLFPVCLPFPPQEPACFPLRPLSTPPQVLPWSQFGPSLQSNLVEFYILELRYEFSPERQALGQVVAFSLILCSTLKVPVTLEEQFSPLYANLDGSTVFFQLCGAFMHDNVLGSRH